MGTKRKTLRGKRSTQRKQKRFLGGVVWPTFNYTEAERNKYTDAEKKQLDVILEDYEKMKKIQKEINDTYTNANKIDKNQLIGKLVDYKQQMRDLFKKNSKLRSKSIPISKDLLFKATGQVDEALENIIKEEHNRNKYVPTENLKKKYQEWGKPKLEAWLKQHPNAYSKDIDNYLDYLEKEFRRLNPHSPSAPLPLPPGPSAPLPLPPGPSAPKPIAYPVNKGLLYENKQRDLARREQDNKTEKFIHDKYGYKPKPSEMKIILDYFAGNESLRNDEALLNLLEHIDKHKQKVGNDVPKKTSPLSSPAMSALTQSTPTKQDKPMTIMKEKQRLHRVKSEPMSPPSTPTSLLTQATSPKQKQTIKPSDENDMSPLTQATPTSAKTKQYDAEHAPPPPLYDADHPAPPPPSIQKTAMPKTLLQQIQQTPRLKQKTITKSSVVPVSGNTMLKHTLLERATQRRKQISPGSVSSDSTWKSGGSKRKTQRK